MADVKRTLIDKLPNLDTIKRGTANLLQKPVGTPTGPTLLNTLNSLGGNIATGLHGNEVTPQERIAGANIAQQRNLGAGAGIFGDIEAQRLAGDRIRIEERQGQERRQLNDAVQEVLTGEGDNAQKITDAITVLEQAEVSEDVKAPMRQILQEQQATLQENQSAIDLQKQKHRDKLEEIKETNKGKKLPKAAEGQAITDRRRTITAIRDELKQRFPDNDFSDEIDILTDKVPLKFWAIDPNKGTSPVLDLIADLDENVSIDQVNEFVSSAVEALDEDTEGTPKTAIAAFLKENPGANSDKILDFLRKKAEATNVSITSLMRQIAREIAEERGLPESEVLVEMFGLKERREDVEKALEEKLKGKTTIGQDIKNFFGFGGGGEKTTTDFNTVEEAEAANLPKGTEITIGGRKARVK